MLRPAYGRAATCLRPCCDLPTTVVRPAYGRAATYLRLWCDLPAVGARSPAMQRKMVDLPAPLIPTSPTTCGPKECHTTLPLQALQYHYRALQYHFRALQYHFRALQYHYRALQYHYKALQGVTGHNVS